MEVVSKINRVKRKIIEINLMENYVQYNKWKF